MVVESFNVSQEIDLSFIEEKIEKAVSEKKSLKKKNVVKHSQLKHKTDKKLKGKEISCSAKA